MNYEITQAQLFDHKHNRTITNERAVEIPLALRYLKAVGSAGEDLVEVGAVTPYYCDNDHRVIDPYDKRGTIKARAEDYDFTDENVLSISTIEHIGADNQYEARDPMVEGLAFKVLEKIYQESKSCFISWGMGFNLALDETVRKNQHNFNHFFYHRTGERDWVLLHNPENFNVRYGMPFRCANSVIFITKNL